MPRVEIFVTTTLINEEGAFETTENKCVAFVNDETDAHEVEHVATLALLMNCEMIEEFDNHNVRYCVGIVYVKNEALISLSITNSDVAENIVPLHSPDWSRIN